MTKHEAIVISAYTGVLCCKFSDMHEYIEKKMGRPVFTHEMGDQKFMDKVKATVKPDFMEVISLTAQAKPETEPGAVSNALVLVNRARHRIDHDFADFSGRHTDTCPGCYLDQALAILANIPQPPSRPVVDAEVKP